MDVEIYKSLSMYDFAMDVYQKAMHMKVNQNAKHYDVQEIINYLQWIVDTEKSES